MVPRLALRFVKTASFFSLVNLAHEFTGVRTGQWRFPGQFVGNIHLLGVRFPVEEFVFFIVLGATVLLADYEYFVDDLK